MYYVKDTYKTEDEITCNVILFKTEKEARSECINAIQREIEEFELENESAVNFRIAPFTYEYEDEYGNYFNVKYGKCELGKIF